MKTLETFEFKARGAAFGAPKHNWDTLLDGNIYQLTKGEDYDCKTLTIQAMLRSKADKRGLGVRVSVSKEDGREVVTTQAYEFTEEEKVAREEAREARKLTRKHGGTTAVTDPISPGEGDPSEPDEGDDEVFDDGVDQEPEHTPEPVPELTKPVVPPKKPGGKKK